MRIQEILIESHQLDEGPILNKIGTAVGKGVGTLAKGVGAVAGGVAGLGSAVKKGFQAGKATVGGAGDDPAAPAAGAAPAAAGVKPAAGSGGTSTKPKGFLAGVKAGQSQGLSAFNDPNVVGSSTPAGGAPAADDEDPAPAAGATTPPSATDINKAGPKGTAQAKPIQGTVAKQAAAKTGAALAGQDQAQAGQTMYTQVKANIDKLDKKGKQRILQLLQKSMSAPAAGGAAPAAGGAAPGNFDGKTGAPLSDKAKASAEFDASPAGKAQQAKVDAMGTAPAAGGAAPANTMANAPVSKTNTAKPSNPNAAPAVDPAAPKKTGGKVAGQLSQTPGAIAKRAKRTSAASANSAGAGAFGQMAKQAQTAGKINTGSLVLEGFSLFRKK